MTKREKYFKEEITPNEAYDLLFEFAGYISLLPMNNQDDRINVYDKVMEFLNQDIKPVLTQDEKAILRNIREAYSMIGKDEYGDIILKKVGDNIKIANWAGIFKKNLFQFIQPRRRI